MYIHNYRERQNMHACTYTYIQTDIQKEIDLFTPRHTYINTYIHTYIHTYTQRQTATVAYTAVDITAAET